MMTRDQLVEKLRAMRANASDSEAMEALFGIIFDSELPTRSTKGRGSVPDIAKLSGTTNNYINIGRRLANLVTAKDESKWRR